MLRANAAPSLSSGVWTLSFEDDTIRQNSTSFTADEDVTIIFDIPTVTEQNTLNRSLTEVNNSSELSAITTDNVVALAIVATEFGSYTVGDLLFYNGTDWAVIFDASDFY